ncbi:MAG: hypothetical protein GC172_08775 [Phycisphaera sp.]|nr:hypothetical protein [Phycisphaera sp.]
MRPSVFSTADDSAQRHRARAAVVLALAAGLLGAGCSGRALVPNESDRLREELAAANDARGRAESRADELESRLASLARERQGEIDPEVAAALPALASVTLSSKSTARLADSEPSAQDGGTLSVALIVTPADGLARFIQITGTLRLTVAALVAGADAIETTSVTVGPKALRDAYRSGFLGTHYTVECTVPWKGESAPRALSVAGEFTDGLTGRVYPIVGTVPVVAAPRRAATASASDPN